MIQVSMNKSTCWKTNTLCRADDMVDFDGAEAMHHLDRRVIFAH